MCDFKPGDEVVCVNAGPVRAPGCKEHGLSVPLVKNRVYVIDRVFWRESRLGTVKAWAVTLTDQATYMSTLKDGSPNGFGAYRFRKVQRRDLGAWLKTATKNTDKIDKSAREKVKA